MLRTILLTVGMLMSIGIYVPLFRRILKRRATRDFSKTSQFFIVLVQANGLLLATAEHAHYLQWWYVLQLVLTAAQLAVIAYYWDNIPPLMRAQQAVNIESKSQ